MDAEQKWHRCRHQQHINQKPTTRSKTPHHYKHSSSSRQTGPNDNSDNNNKTKHSSTSHNPSEQHHDDKPHPDGRPHDKRQHGTTQGPTNELHKNFSTHSTSNNNTTTNNIDLPPKIPSIAGGVAAAAAAMERASTPRQFLTPSQARKAEDLSRNKVEKAAAVVACTDRCLESDDEDEGKAGGKPAKAEEIVEPTPMHTPRKNEGLYGKAPKGDKTNKKGNKR